MSGTPSKSDNTVGRPVAIASISASPNASLCDGKANTSRPASNSGAGAAKKSSSPARVGGDPARLRDIAAAAVNDRPGAIEDHLNRELPGYALAGTTTLELSVVLPGRVVDTNGEVGDNGVVTCSFQLGDPVVGPRECWARSEVGREAVASGGGGPLDLFRSCPPPGRP